MPPTFPTIGRILAELHAQEQVKAAHHDAEAARSRGVCHSGMGPDPFTAKTHDELQALAHQRAAQIDAYLASPDGRYGAAVRRLRVAGHPEWERLLSLRSMGAAGWIDRAMAALEWIRGPDAECARQALREMASQEVAA